MISTVDVYGSYESPVGNDVITSGPNLPYNFIIIIIIIIIIVIAFWSRGPKLP